jgi:hypothetical protein
VVDPATCRSRRVDSDPKPPRQAIPQPPVTTPPATGFAVSQSKAKADEITVKFDASNKNDERRSAVKIKKSRVVSTSCEDENFNRRSDSEEIDPTDNNDESADD